jgi:hypothetical protein
MLVVSTPRFNSYHEAFLRSRPDLTQLIVRLKNEGRRFPNIELEPDFHQMGFLPNISQPVQQRQFQPGGTAEAHSQHGDSAVLQDYQTISQPLTATGLKVASTEGDGTSLNHHETNFKGSQIHAQSHEGDHLSELKQNPTKSLITDSSSSFDMRRDCNMSRSEKTNPTEGRDRGGQSCHRSSKRSRTTISQEYEALLSNPPNDPLLREFAETYLPFFSSSESSGDESGDAP